MLTSFWHVLLQSQSRPGCYFSDWSSVADWLSNLQAKAPKQTKTDSCPCTDSSKYRPRTEFGPVQGRLSGPWWGVDPCWTRAALDPLGARTLQLPSDWRAGAPPKAWCCVPNPRRSSWQLEPAPDLGALEETSYYHPPFGLGGPGWKCPGHGGNEGPGLLLGCNVQWRPRCRHTHPIYVHKHEEEISNNVNIYILLLTLLRLSRMLFPRSAKSRRHWFKWCRSRVEVV